MHELCECLRHPGLLCTDTIATSENCSNPLHSAESQPTCDRLNHGIALHQCSNWPNVRLNMAVGQTGGCVDTILGRRRVATLPQAMLNMAFGQKKHANGAKQHHPGLHATGINTPTALNNIAQGKLARAPRVPAPPWVKRVRHAYANGVKQHSPG